MRRTNRRLRRLPQPYCDYQAQKTSWNDGSRCRRARWSLQVMGPAMTDTRLRDKQDHVLYTVRPDNVVDRVGMANAEDISVVVGNDKLASLKVISLKELLQNVFAYAWYVNMTANTDLFAPHLDDQISVRFQYTFLPVDDKPGSGIEFVPESYNYNTIDPNEPRNLIIVATSQGVSFYQDSVGYQKLYYQEADSLGNPHLHWYRIEKTAFGVGSSRMSQGPGAQRLGIPAMGRRFNAMLTIQVPLKQSVALLRSPGKTKFPPEAFFSASSGGSRTASRRDGQSNVANLHKGSELGIWDELLSVASVRRDPHEHITATVVLFHTVTGGTPSTKDMKAAIDEMELLSNSLKRMSSTQRTVPCSNLRLKKHEKHTKVIPTSTGTGSSTHGNLGSGSGGNLGNKGWSGWTIDRGWELGGSTGRVRITSGNTGPVYRGSGRSTSSSSWPFPEGFSFTSGSSSGTGGTWPFGSRNSPFGKGFPFGSASGR